MAAALVLRAPASAPARVCVTCLEAGDLEARVDLVIEETAGVGGEITGITVLLSNGSTVFEGPGTFDREVILRFGAPTTRVNARGSLTIPQIGVHFPGGLRDRLPATLRFTVMFRDDHRNTTSAEIAIAITPAVGAASAMPQD